MANTLSLIGLSGAQLSQSQVFSERSTVIGSDPQCGVVMKDRLIFPRHAEVRLALGHWFILPLDPKAMVLLNGTQVRGQQRINAGDLVTLGSITFKAAFGTMERAVGTRQHEADQHGTEDMWHD